MPYKLDGVDGTNTRKGRQITIYCSTAVAVGDWVEVDTADTTNGAGNSVKKAATAAGGLVCAVAEETITAAGNVQITVSGMPITQVANVATASGIGDALKHSSTAGRCETATAKDGEQVCGWAITEPASNVAASVFVRDRGFWPA